jgi:hypothetical protein
MRRALVCPCRHRPQCGRDHGLRAQDDVLPNLRADLLKQRLSLDRIGPEFIVRPAAKIATWLMAAPFVALSLGTIAADGMAISNVEIRAGALCTAGFILAAVGCVSLLKRQK